MLKNKWIILIAPLLLLLFGYLLLLQWNIYRYAHKSAETNIEYIIVLGARVKGETPSLSLQYRINAAATFLKENPGTIAIVSGGKGRGETISEAEAMRRGLASLGIEETRIIKEEESINTHTNIENSRQLIPKNLKNGGIVTNNYHLYRTIKIAEKQGLKLSPIPAGTPKAAIIKSYIREYAAITKYLLTDQIDW